MENPLSENEEQPLGFDKNFVRKYFETDKTETGKKLLVREKRKIAKCLQEMREEERTIKYVCHHTA